MIRGVIALLMLAALTVSARADEHPVDCSTIRMYVAQHGKARALAWALENGYGWRQIRAASRCLKEKN